MADTKLYCLLDPSNCIRPDSVLCADHYTVDAVKRVTLSIPDLSIGDLPPAWYECTGHPVACTLCPRPRYMLPPGTTPERQALFEEFLGQLDEMVEYYGLKEPEVPDRIINYLIGSVTAPTDEEARDICHRSLNKMHAHCGQMWATGKATGADNPITLLKRAKKLEYEADRLEAKAKDGKEELEDKRRRNANDKRIKAIELRKRAEMLKGSVEVTYGDLAKVS